MAYDRTQPGYVYFARRADGEGPIKIGCSRCPADRLMALTVWSPYPLALMATMPGDERLEWQFHARFEAQHSHSEWFHPSLELLDAIQAVKDGAFDVGTLPPPKRIYGQRVGNGWSAATRKSAGWTHRIMHLNRRGIREPEEVAAAIRRFAYGSAPAHDPADAAIVDAWLAENPPARRARKAA